MTHTSQNILEELQVHRLPTLPHLLIEILNACQDRSVTFQEIADLVSRDAAIAARAVAMANSSFFNRGTPIRSLDRALLVLGTDTIKTIVITATIQQFFSGINNHDQGYLKEFWRRSLSCALLSKSLAILTSYPKPDEAYLCGLLHNIGELVLATNYPESFDRLRTSSENESDRSTEEEKAFKIDHASLGALLLEKWGLSNFAADAVRYHHALIEQIIGAHHLVKVLFMASELSRSGQNAFDELIGERLFELNASLVAEILNKIEEEVGEVAASMGIKISDANPEDPDGVQVTLAKSIRDHNLLSASQSVISQGSSREDFARQVKQSFSLLYGIQCSAVFWLKDDQLELVIDSQDAVPMAFALDGSASIVAKAAIDKKASHIFKDKVSAVADQQLLSMLDSKGLLCLPLADETKTYAVVIAGLQSEKEQIHPSFLSLLTSQLTEQCQRIQSPVDKSEQDLELSILNAKVREIAHEANNPLSIINNYLASLAIKLGDQEDVQEELLVLREELERASQIILRLRDVQQVENRSDDDTDVNQEITNLLTLYKNSLFLAKQIRHEIQLDKGLSRHKISKNSLRQILTNLIKNAVEALPENGKITISTKSSVNVNGRPFTEIRIEDDGPGIPGQIQAQLFSPVPSTKGSGHSGLGLSITKNLVTDARGTISCRSDEKGSQFQILLPES